MSQVITIIRKSNCIRKHIQFIVNHITAALFNSTGLLIGTLLLINKKQRKIIDKKNNNPITHKIHKSPNAIIIIINLIISIIF
jgi:hypothetical protein